MTTAYQYYTKAFAVAQKTLQAGHSVLRAQNEVSKIMLTGIKSGTAWRLAAVAIKDAVESLGGFAVEAGSRQADACYGPVFNGQDLRDIRPADRALVGAARGWAVANDRLSAELTSVHAGQCQYFLLAL